jgi:hypothetical protein
MKNVKKVKIFKYLHNYHKLKKRRDKHLELWYFKQHFRLPNHYQMNSNLQTYQELC